MVKTKEDLNRYLLADKVAMGRTEKHPRLLGDRIWRFQILYRRCEYHFNNRDHLLHKVLYGIDYLRFKKKCMMLNSEFPLNVFQEGLVIWHGQNIIVNPNVRVGKNFSISASCCIGHAHDLTPVIGNNVTMMIGSKVLGGITIADDVTIGADALVIKDIAESYTTVGGVPARCISRSINVKTEAKKERLRDIGIYDTEK